MCSSPKGSGSSTVNKPRARGLLVSMDSSARSNYTAAANAADNKREQRRAHKQKQQSQQPLSEQPVSIQSTTANIIYPQAWYQRLWQFFY